MDESEICKLVKTGQIMYRDMKSMHLKVDSISRDYDSFKSNQMNENAEYAIHVQSIFDLLNSTLTKIKERDPLTARVS